MPSEPIPTWTTEQLQLVRAELERIYFSSLRGQRVTIEKRLVDIDVELVARGLASMDVHQ